MYNESKQLNWMKLFGQGKLNLARNQVKEDTIIPFNTNITYGKYYNDNFLGENRNGCDCILI